jgi:hypothetical protein
MTFPDVKASGPLLKGLLDLLQAEDCDFGILCTIYVSHVSRWCLLCNSTNPEAVQNGAYCAAHQMAFHVAM